MAAPALYVSSVCGGIVLTNMGNYLQNKNPNNSTSQHWTVEQGDKSNVVAFKNVGNGTYLNAKNGNAYGAVGTGAKQWWTLEEGTAPGSFWLKCNDYPDAYLCNAGGSHADGTKVYIWPKQAKWTWTLTWYLKDTAHPSNWNDSAAADYAEAEKMADVIEKKEAELVEREKAVAGAQELLDEAKKISSETAEKEKAIAAQEADHEAKSKALEEREKTLASKPSPKGKNGKELAAREKKLAEKEEELKKLEAELADQAKTGDNADLVEKQAALKEKEAELERKEAELEKKSSSLANHGTSSESELVAKNAKLQSELDAMRKKVSEAEKRPGKLAGQGIPFKTSTRAPPTARPFQMKPPNVRPSIVKANSTKPPISMTSFNPEMVKRFEAGKKVMKSM